MSWLLCQCSEQVPLKAITLSEKAHFQLAKKKIKSMMTTPSTIQCYIVIMSHECASFHQQLLLCLSFPFSEAAGAAVLFFSLVMATPVICRWFSWQWNWEHLARHRDRACRLYSPCVFVCACNSLGDF